MQEGEMDLLARAETIAVKAHAGQKDKCGVDYIEHPRTVSRNCTSYEAKVVGMLHDVVEDTPITMEDLREEGFPETILEALRCVTKEAGYEVHEYYDRIKANPIAREVKLADLNHNLDAGRFPSDASEQYRKWAQKKRPRYERYRAYLLNQADTIDIESD